MHDLPILQAEEKANQIVQDNILEVIDTKVQYSKMFAICNKGSMNHTYQMGPIALS